MSAQRLLDFCEWLPGVGVESGALELRRGCGAAGGRGAFATRAIRPGEPIVRLPRSAVIHVVDGDPSPVPGISDAAWRALPWQPRLAHALLRARRGTRFGPYVATLPAVPTRAARIDQRLLDKACYPPVTRDAAREREAQRAWLEVVRADGELRDVGEEEWLWALDAVFSRAFSGNLGEEVARAPLAARAVAFGTAMVVSTSEQAPAAVRVAASCALLYLAATEFLADSSEGGEEGEAQQSRVCYGLFPMVDAINHRTRSATRIEHVGSDDTFALRADGACEAGAEYFHSYGRLSNDVLLARYGFVERQNPADVYVFNDFVARLAAGQSRSGKTVPQRATLGRDGELDAPADALLCATFDGDIAAARDALLCAIHAEQEAFAAACAAAPVDGAGAAEAAVREFRAEKAAVLRDGAAAVERGERTYGRRRG